MKIRKDIEIDLSVCACCPEVAHTVHPGCFHWYLGSGDIKLAEFGDMRYSWPGFDDEMANLTGYTADEFLQTFISGNEGEGVADGGKDR